MTLNEKKTSIRDARQERFDFLGYTFGPHFSPRTGGKYLGYSPSLKSMKRLRENVRGHLERGNTKPWEEVRDRLNQKLRGWAQYFPTGEAVESVRGVRRVCGRSRAALPEKAAQGVLARHPSVFDEADLRCAGRVPATRSAWWRAFVSLR